MKRLTAFSLCLFLLVPLMFACTDKAEVTAVSQRLFMPDRRELYTRLYSLYVSDADNATKQAEAESILSLFDAAYTENQAGGVGFEGKIYTDGDYVVTTDDEFMSAAKKATAGEVIFVPSGVTIDMADLYDTDTYTPKLAEGVILASDRGINEGGVLRFSHPSGTLVVCSNNVTVTGINLCGVVSPSGMADSHPVDNGIRIDGTGITISNCEIASFNKSGITTFPKGEAVVTHCYIHDCATGVADRDFGLTLENNLFYRNETDYKNDKDKTTVLPENNYVQETAEKAASVITQVNPDITSAVFPNDVYPAYLTLKKIAAGETDLIIDALTQAAGTSKYYYYKDKMYISQDGKDYGVRDDGEPLGGGENYSDIITTGDYVVTDTASFVSALRSAKSGETVFIPSGTKISVTGLTLTVPEGVTVASDRGRIGEDGKLSAGGMLYTTTRQSESIILSANSRFTGITFVGADTEKHLTHLKRGLNEAGTSYTDYYYSLLLSRAVVISGDNAEVDNCEISGFSEVGVLVGGYKGAKIHHNYIHHNQRDGFGYGVSIYNEGEAEIYRNIFNHDRHAIAADGTPGSGYYAHDNIHLGEAIRHIFDAHGGADRGDGTDIACDKVEMTNNVFLSAQLPYKKRGTPTEASIFKNNLVIYPEGSYEYRFFYGHNFICEDNIFGIAEKDKSEYSFENGNKYTVNLSGVTKYEDMEYIDSKTHSLRYKYIIVFTPNDDGGYYISEYGNNLDDGSICNWNEKVYIPEGGFVITFTSSSEGGIRLYNAISKRHKVIYNTTIMLDGDFIAHIEDDKIKVTEAE